MTNPKEQEIEINEMVRDFTQVKPRAKSEVRRRILDLLHSDREALREAVEKMKKEECAECNIHDGRPHSERCELINAVLSLLSPNK